MFSLTTIENCSDSELIKTGEQFLLETKSKLDFELCEKALRERARTSNIDFKELNRMISVTSEKINTDKRIKIDDIAQQIASLVSSKGVTVYELDKIFEETKRKLIL